MPLSTYHLEPGSIPEGGELVLEPDGRFEIRDEKYAVIFSGHWKRNFIVGDDDAFSDEDAVVEVDCDDHLMVSLTSLHNALTSGDANEIESARAKFESKLRDFMG